MPKRSRGELEVARYCGELEVARDDSDEDSVAVLSAKLEPKRNCSHQVTGLGLLPDINTMADTWHTTRGAATTRDGFSVLSDSSGDDNDSDSDTGINLGSVYSVGEHNDTTKSSHSYREKLKNAKDMSSSFLWAFRAVLAVEELLNGALRNQRFDVTTQFSGMGAISMALVFINAAVNAFFHRDFPAAVRFSCDVKEKTLNC